MRCSLWETSKKLFLLSVFCTHAEQFQEQICIFLSITHAHRVQNGCGKFRHKSFGYSLEKSERPCVLFFHELFDDFLERIRYSHNDRHVCIIPHSRTFTHPPPHLSESNPDNTQLVSTDLRQSPPTPGAEPWPMDLQPSTSGNQPASSPPARIKP